MHDFTTTWHNKFLCNNCDAIIDTIVCPCCSFEQQPIKEVSMPGSSKSYTLRGAITYVTFSLLKLIKREWERSPDNLPANQMSDVGIPEKVNIVIIFWILHEHLMTWLFEEALKKEKAGIAEDLLNRYSTISAKQDKLYKICFNTTFKKDMISQGHESLYNHLEAVRIKRNAFMHGDPFAIDNDLIEKTVQLLDELQAAWINIYNSRIVNCPLVN